MCVGVRVCVLARVDTRGSLSVCVSISRSVCLCVCVCVCVTAKRIKSERFVVQPGIPTKRAPSKLHDLLLMKIADGMMSIATAIELAHAAATDQPESACKHIAAFRHHSGNMHRNLLSYVPTCSCEL